MILGIGCDLLDMRRIEKAVKRFPNRFAERLLSLDEKKDPRAKTPTSMAKRFAAKEACSKACGVGIGRFLSFQDITIKHGQKAAPQIFLSSQAVDKIWGGKIAPSEIKLDLSLSDEYPYVQAFVILSRV